LVISVIAIALLVALPIASRVEALGSGGSHNPLAAFKSDDKDKDKDQGDGNGNGQSNEQHGNGQSDDDHGNGNGQSDDDHGNGNGQSDDDHGNGNGQGDGDVSDDQGDDSGGGDDAGNSGGSSADHGQSSHDHGDANNDDEDSAEDEQGDSSQGDEEEADDAGTPTAGDGGKVRLCHLTGRDDYPYNLIEVNEHALDAHEGHGDFVAPDDAVSSNDCQSSEEGSGTPVGPTEEPTDESGTPGASPEAGAKVLVCHVTGSADNPVILIDVSENALPAHLGHGDIAAPEGSRSSNDCELAMEGTPVASPTNSETATVSASATP